jgi:hypothetical protein
MRILIALFVQLALSASALACDCFSPEQRVKASEDALAKARLAVLGRVVEVTASGIAKVLVLESFKGPAKGEVVEARQDFGLCAGASKGQSFTAGEETFILSFGAAATACDKLATDNFLLEGIRFIVKGK